VNGSLIVFGLMFVAALFVGRLWCAWACPAAGMMEACFMVTTKPVRGGRLNWIKWGIWIPWIAVIVMAVVSSGGYHSVNFFHLTESGISVDQPLKYIIYFMVLIPIFVLSLTAGRRAFCHYGCWMAPFMILGHKLRNWLNTPALRLQIQNDACNHCKQCNRACPMSLDVHAMVQSGQMAHSECILCASCIDTCPKHVLRYRFDRGK
jgi:polyferredoxin